MGEEGFHPPAEDPLDETLKRDAADSKCADEPPATPAIEFEVGVEQKHAESFAGFARQLLGFDKGPDAREFGAPPTEGERARTQARALLGNTLAPLAGGALDVVSVLVPIPGDKPSD
jgi:hypothetical protein